MKFFQVKNHDKIGKANWENTKKKTNILTNPNKPMLLPTLFAPSFFTALRRACPVVVKDDYSIAFITLTFTTAINLEDSTQLVSEDLNRDHSSAYYHIIILSYCLV